MAFTSVTVTKSWENPDGTIPVGTVTFTLSAEITDSSTGKSVPAEPIVAALAGGVLKQTLLANNDTTTVPTGTIYAVSEVVDGLTNTYNISIPFTATSPVVLLTLVVP